MWRVKFGARLPQTLNYIPSGTLLKAQMCQTIHQANILYLGRNALIILLLLECNQRCWRTYCKSWAHLPSSIVMLSFSCKFWPFKLAKWVLKEATHSWSTPHYGNVECSLLCSRRWTMINHGTIPNTIVTHCGTRLNIAMNPCWILQLTSPWLENRKLSAGWTESSTKKLILIMFWEIKIWKITGTLWTLFLHMRKFIHSRNPRCIYVEMLIRSEMGCLP